MIFKYNISLDNDYHSQVNNRRFPMSSCNTTSAIMALKNNKIDFYSPPSMQEEDYLTSLLETEEAYDKLNKEFPWAVKDGIPPREVHAMLEWAINKLTRNSYDKFTTYATLEQILYNIAIKKESSLMTGRFTKYGHIVCVSGFITEQDNIEETKTINMDKVQKVIIDDPYGNYFTEYKDVHGNNIEINIKDFDSLTKNYSSKYKWAHIISKDNIKE